MLGLAPNKHFFNQTPLYERNYSQLLRALAELYNDGECAVTHSSGIRFQIKIVEDHKYTTVMELKVGLAHSSTSLLNPVMTVRMYHDAKVAEVASYSGHSKFQPEYAYPNKHMFQPDEKRQVNLLLSEWLGLLTCNSAYAFQSTQDSNNFSLE